MKKAYAVYLAVTVPFLLVALFFFGEAAKRFVAVDQAIARLHATEQAAGKAAAKPAPVIAPRPVAPAESARNEAARRSEAASLAQMKRLEKALEDAFPDPPAPPATPVSGAVTDSRPGAGASVNLGGAPDRAPLAGLKQAVNPTPGGSSYQGQLLWGYSGAKRHRREIYSGGIVHPTLGRVGIRRGVQPKLAPGTYQLPYGKLTVH